MKVISIKDAPLAQNGFTYNGVYLDRAYYRGDIFEVAPKSISDKFFIILHDKLGFEMAVDKLNFISLEEYRNQKINKLLDK